MVNNKTDRAALTLVETLSTEARARVAAQGYFAWEEHFERRPSDAVIARISQLLGVG